MSWLMEQQMREGRALRAVGLRPGDYVSLAGCRGHVWGVVKSYWEGQDDHFGPSCSVYTGRGMSEHTFGHRIAKVHRKDDPWDYKEVQLLHGVSYDYHLGTPPQGMLPLPEEVQYTGTFTPEVWLWNYCGRNVQPKGAKSLDPYFERLSMSQQDGIPWHQIDVVITMLRCLRIGGWAPVCRPKPKQNFNLTIKIEAKWD